MDLTNAFDSINTSTLKCPGDPRSLMGKDRMCVREGARKGLNADEAQFQMRPILLSPDRRTSALRSSLGPFPTLGSGSLGLIKCSCEQIADWRRNHQQF